MLEIIYYAVGSTALLATAYYFGKLAAYKEVAKIIEERKRAVLQREQEGV